MTNKKELKILKRCLFYYTMPKFLIWFSPRYYRSYINSGFCYYFNHICKPSLKDIPKSLKLAYIGSKYYDADCFYGNQFWISFDYNKKERLKIRIELLESAIHNLKVNIRIGKL